MRRMSVPFDVPLMRCSAYHIVTRSNQKSQTMLITNVGSKVTAKPVMIEYLHVLT